MNIARLACRSAWTTSKRPCDASGSACAQNCVSPDASLPDTSQISEQPRLDDCAPHLLRGLCCAGAANVLHTASGAAPCGSDLRSRERANALTFEGRRVLLVVVAEFLPNNSRRRGHGANSTASSRRTRACKTLPAQCVSTFTAISSQQPWQAHVRSGEISSLSRVLWCGGRRLLHCGHLWKTQNVTVTKESHQVQDRATAWCASNLSHAALAQAGDVPSSQLQPPPRWEFCPI